MNVLLVEDTSSAIETCKEWAEQYTEAGKNISIIVAESLSETFGKLSQDIDAAIIDIKLNGENGNDAISKMQELYLRIPTVVHTGTPDDVTVGGILRIFTRGDGYQKIFDYLLDIYNTGINEILGRKGLLEQQINKFYNSVFINTKDSWISKAKECPDAQVKKALLRNAIYHLENLLEDDNEKTFLEEFYLYDSDGKIHTGSLLKDKQETRYYILISPACDLVIRKNGKRNVDVLTLCEINPIEIYGVTLKSETTSTLGSDKRKSISSILSNSKNRYHWIPEIENFKGGILDFTKTISIAEKELADKYRVLDYRIAPPYMKNILSRFSSYYARQGQPDLDVDSYLDRLTLFSVDEVR